MVERVSCWCLWTLTSLHQRGLPVPGVSSSDQLSRPANVKLTSGSGFLHQYVHLPNISVGSRVWHTDLNEKGQSKNHPDEHSTHNDTHMSQSAGGDSSDTHTHTHTRYNYYWLTPETTWVAEAWIIIEKWMENIRMFNIVAIGMKALIYNYKNQ